jgi:hypothetical protein
VQCLGPSVPAMERLFSIEAKSFRFSSKERVLPVTVGGKEEEIRWVYFREYPRLFLVVRHGGSGKLGEGEYRQVVP